MAYPRRLGVLRSRVKIKVGPIMREIPNHLSCFGRAADLKRLADRVRRRGVTFVMAQPRMGKTWLVRNLAFEWARQQNWNVAYAQSSGGKNDLLREVVADHYKRWLDGANVVAQAKSLWARHKDGLVGKVGGEVGKLLGKIAALADGDAVMKEADACPNTDRRPGAENPFTC